MSALKKVFPRLHFRYQKDPYAQDLEQFAEWLCARRNCNKSARTHLYNVQQALHRMRAPVGSTFIAEDLRAALRGATSARCQWQHTFSICTTFLQVHDRLLERKPKPVDRSELVRREFGKQLTHHRGLRPATVADYDHWIGDFLRRSLPADRPLSSLTAAWFEHYIKDRLPELASSTLHTAFNCIRAFLQYSFKAGLISSCADVVDRPASIGEDRPPRALPWPLIQQFLRSIDQSDWVGRRDYLIMHLMAHYALRTGEAGFLKADSIDWKRDPHGQSSEDIVDSATAHR